MALESRYLSASTSFTATATSWAKNVGLLDVDGDPISIYPTIIGMPSGSTDLAGFSIGIIQNNRTIKQALQDLETAVDGRMFAGNNLSDIPNTATARTNLGLASAATWPVGTSGSTLGLLSTVNSYSGKQNFTAGVSVTTTLDVTGSSGVQTVINILNGTSKRWSVYKEETVDSATSTGSDFRIGRFNNSGVKIDDPISISRATGVVTLSQPLPLASGGTGATSLSNLRTQLSINNVDNTADINKPISSATQNALNLKFDKAGGNIAGFLTTTSYIRSTSVIIEGGADEGGQIILGHRNNSGLTGQSNSTWNIDVDGTNNLRFFNQRSSGTIVTPMQFGEAGNTIFNGDGDILGLVGGSIGSQGISIRHQGATSSAGGNGFLSFQNSNGTTVAHIVGNINTDGSSDVAISVTASGSRTVDRRSEVIKISTSGIAVDVPINGRAYPRLADGGNVNFNWSGQPGQPSWLWGGNNGTDMFVYNPSNLSVNNSANLVGVVGGNLGGYIRRTTDISANGNLSRQLVLAGNGQTEDVWSSPIEIREVNQVASSNTSSTYAPGLLFHWGSVSAGAIKLHSDGSFRFQSQNTTLTYAPVWGGNFYSSGNYHVSGGGGLYFSTYSRDVATAEAGGNYGHLNTVGGGMNGYGGYSINTWASFMANGTDTGIYSSSQNRWLVRFDNAGNATFPANVTAFSDERLKQNIRPIDNITDRRKSLANAAILYERHNVTRIGFGAQTLEIGNPELVFTADDLVGTKSVNYGDAVAILAVDNQMLSDRIVELEAKNKAIENALDLVLIKLEKAGL